MTNKPSDGIDFSFVRGGTRGKPRLLFLHGFMGTKEDWDPIVKQLAGSVDSLAVDLPGHGQTEVNDDRVYLMPGCADALIAFLQEQDFLPCNLVAYSMGGRLALYLLLNRAECFSKAILESASPGLKTETERIARTKLDEARADELETASLTYFLSNWYVQPMFEGMRRDKTRFEQLLQRRLLGNKNGWIKSLRLMGSGQQPSQWENLNQLSTPVCLIVGKNDGKFCGIAEEMKKCSRLLEVEETAGSGHNIHFEQPDLYEDCVRRFLDL